MHTYMCVYIYIYIYMSLSLSLSIYIYIYIYMYIFKFQGWNSQVHSEFPGHCASRNLCLEILSVETGRSEQVLVLISKRSDPNPSNKSYVTEFQQGQP